MNLKFLGHEVRRDLEIVRKRNLFDGVNKLEPMFQDKTERSDLELAIIFAENTEIDKGDKLLIVNYPNTFTLALYSYLVAPNGQVYGIHSDKELFENINEYLRKLTTEFMLKYDSIDEKYFVLKDSVNSMQFYLPWERRRRGKRNSAKERGSFVSTSVIYNDWKGKIICPDELSSNYDKIILFPNDALNKFPFQENLKLDGKLAYIETKILEEQKTSLLGIVTRKENEFLIENKDLKLKNTYNFKKK